MQVAGFFRPFVFAGRKVSSIQISWLARDGS
jgi:hypothetical protein